MANSETHAGEIRGILDVIAQQAKGQPKDWSPDEDGEWTRIIKQRIDDLGRKKDFATYANGVIREGIDEKYEKWHGGEWLYDLCWLDYGGKNAPNGGKWLYAVPLALESEWERSCSDIYDDFQKLLQASAQLRVMILQADDESHATKLMEELLRPAIKRFAAGEANDHYLIGIFLRDVQDFAFWEIRARMECKRI